MSDPEPLEGAAVARELVAEAHAALRAGGLTVGVAESLTGGLLAEWLTDQAGASATFRGGVVAYATPVKAAVLGVPPELLAARGAVDPEVALAMARGARAVLGAGVGVATTGVAGPDPQDGQPVGTVFVAVSGPGSPAGERVEAHRFAGDRAAIRVAAAVAALRLLLAGVG